MRIGVMTSGGDAPGMNACVAALTQEGASRGWEVVGIRDGWLGLLEERAEPLDVATGTRFGRYGGTWLGTSRVPDLRERMPEAPAALAGLGLDGLVVLGGNGSLAAAGDLTERIDAPVVGIAATIDNDVAATDLSLGHDTAVAYGVAAADRVRDTTEALPRFFAIETLGGGTGHIALAVGRLSGADAILLPERETPVAETAAAVSRALRTGGALVVASEGVPDLHPMLEEVARIVGMRLRLVTLGHAQRGGAPTNRDRAAAIAYAGVAADALATSRSGIASLRGGRVALVPFQTPYDAPAPDPGAWRGLL